MSLQNELKNLASVYNAVAREAKKDIPEVWDLTVDTLGSEESAVRFLSEPHMLLNGNKPADLAMNSEEGKKEVLQLLYRAQHGIYS